MRTMTLIFAVAVTIILAAFVISIPVKIVTVAIIIILVFLVIPTTIGIAIEIADCRRWRMRGKYLAQVGLLNKWQVSWMFLVHHRLVANFPSLAEVAISSRWRSFISTSLRWCVSLSNLVRREVPRLKEVEFKSLDPHLPSVLIGLTQEYSAPPKSLDLCEDDLEYYFLKSGLISLEVVEFRVCPRILIRYNVNKSSSNDTLVVSFPISTSTMNAVDLANGWQSDDFTLPSDLRLFLGKDKSVQLAKNFEFLRTFDTIFQNSPNKPARENNKHASSAVVDNKLKMKIDKISTEFRSSFVSRENCIKDIFVKFELMEVKDYPPDAIFEKQLRLRLYPTNLLSPQPTKPVTAEPAEPAGNDYDGTELD